MKTPNTFFQTNAISNYKTTSFCKTQSIFESAAPHKKIKRVSSLSSAKLNPQKFVLRQTFNNKLYQQKAFQISVELIKEQQSLILNGHNFSNLSSHFRIATKQQYIKTVSSFEKNIANLINYFRNIKNISLKDQIGQNQLFCFKETLQKIVKMLNKQMIDKQARYAQLLFKTKIQSSKKSKQSTQLKNLPTQNQDFKKYNLQRKVKQLTQKLKKTQFQNSKLKLLCQKLTNSIQARDAKFIQISKQNKIMKETLSKVKQSQQFLEYKIKKLKQQLQVAHIVKQQNLTQKMKYIMNFQ